jgi:hypothetical protein
MQFSSKQLTQILALSRTSITPSSSSTGRSLVGEPPKAETCLVYSQPNAKGRTGQANSAGPRFDLNDDDELAICV